ncbi:MULTISPECIES: nicotinamide-nucleotide amidohydrolase family protein [Aromatoleum]|uniref:Nicotinamide-nucleotide amidohydrolase family protein n=2 Tax=Aromatoleum TaxID=551759 RepID=A0ABX1NU45_9RHOO|nr:MULTISPECIES: nicotinamide-nucleotide amidohydrolase family protein [Aromatoleum]MCK0507328.1 nicotinamide-nucleotide amidohydrolase family protein [Aromatoleum anaerobium]NMG15529.1 nicotinamide-nucleotide amidohydrolase family protein [Aromatoleum bremense]QTQ31567.1 Amidohydrolase, PncC family [Aromatoleum bremense]
MMDRELAALSAETGTWLGARGMRLASAESCTGGWIAEVVTATAGSSTWFDCGFVTYSNEAKQDLLGVRAATLADFGAVSEETVREMVAGTLARSRADLALAVSGVAGPGGGTAAKPVGMVCFAWGRREAGISSETRHFSGDREAVRRQAVIRALRGIMTYDLPVGR